MQLHLTIGELVALGGVVFWAGGVTWTVWRNAKDIQINLARFERETSTLHARITRHQEVCPGVRKLPGGPKR